MKRPENFEELKKIAESSPDMIGALAQLGVELKYAGHNSRGSERYSISQRSHTPGDLSAVVFFHNGDGSWVAIDNKSRSGYGYLTAIGVLRNLFGQSYDDAVYMLSGGRPSLPPKAVKTTEKTAAVKHTVQKIEFEGLPEKANTKRTYAYLTKTRCIDPNMISSLMKQNLIYDGKLTGSVAVFPIYDENGKAVGADCNGTSTGIDSRTGKPIKFKHIVPGSDIHYAWRFGYNTDKITSGTPLFICESPIDAMSLCCLTKSPGIYISLAGSSTKSETLDSMADKLGGKPVICTDNDEAGNKLRQMYPQYDTLIPKNKDWNDDLCEVRGIDRAENKPLKL